VRRAVEKGLLLFSPVGYGGATVKISPPLSIGEEAVVEGVHVLEECIAGAVGIAA
jgi:4-aminobutyrate aminotransferase / (S)-3-amino-2-methylpropionate transaminase / 5-aminovalerate transaminase